jgi:hypothetical protein
MAVSASEAIAIRIGVGKADYNTAGDSLRPSGRLASRPVEGHPVLLEPSPDIGITISCAVHSLAHDR